MSVRRILFVCTGNTCRSVMAEWFTKHLLERAGVDTMQVDSAGVFAIEGASASREAQRVLQSVRIDCAAHRARSLTVQMIEDADLILAMERFQAEEVIRRVPSASGKIHLLKPYGLTEKEAGLNPEIPDPVGKPLEVYEVCFAEIRDAVERLARSLGVHSG